MSENRCLVERNFNIFKCGRQIVRDEKCIFHLENKTNAEAMIFEKQFWEEFDKMNTSDKELDFTNFIFPNPIKFWGKIIQKPVFFIRARFKDIADFSTAEFNNIDFSDAEFSNKANFSETKFNGEARFHNVQFNGKKKVDFTWANFVDMAFFSEAKFSSEADFAMAKFDKGVYFHKAQFDNNTDFYGSTFMGEVIFQSTIFNNESFINFRSCTFHKPKDVIFQKVMLSNISFLFTDITEIEFLNENWEIKNGRRVVVDESRILEDEYTTYEAVAQLYRRLRRNYENNYRFAESGDFFIGEMEMRRHDVASRLRKENKTSKKIELSLEYCLLSIYKFFDYGENYIYPIIITIIVIVSYPFLIYTLYDTTLPNSTLDYFRTSASSFFQMDNKYVGERILGIPLIGLLFIALKRKFERKK